MSFGAGYHTDDFALVAVDMSWGHYGPLGGKLLPTGQGWATLCGDGDARIGAIAARKAVQRYKGSDPKRWAALLKAAMEEVSGSEDIHEASIVAPLFAHMRDGRPTFDMAISDGRFMSDYTRGKCYFGPTYGVEQERLREEEARVHGTEDPWEAIRQLAAGFEAISGVSEVVSRHVHIAGVKATSGGHTKFHLFGDPQEIQASSEERLRSKAWTPGPSKTPGMSWDRDDFDIPDNVKDRLKFLGEFMPRASGDTVTVGDVAFAGGQVKVEHSNNEWELYSYDPDTSTLGGVCVGVRKAGSGTGTDAQDFTLRVGSEDITVPGTENCGLDGGTDYFVGWDRTNSTLVTSTSRQDALGKDTIFFGVITSAFDDDTGDGSEGGDNTDQGTLK